MAETAVGFLLDNLEQIMLHNADLMQDLGSDVEELHDEFEMMNAYIKEYMPKLGTDEKEGIAKEVRGLVNIAEDIIETFLIHASRQRARSPMERARHKLDFLNKIRSAPREIKETREKVKAIKERIYGIYQRIEKKSVTRSRLKSVTRSRLRRKQIPVDIDVVGFDDEAKTILECLSRGSKELEVIPITGIVGIGKTTLAVKIFNDPRIAHEFEVRAFVYVSKECERREVFLTILAAFIQLTKDMELLTEKRLAEVLRKELESMKYLIVMDDVWTRDVWDEIRIALPNNKKGSRVLLTTQNMNVAFHANPRIQPHQLRFLTLEESKELLQRKVFGNESIPAELEDLARQIVIQCGGLPLTIVVIGGFLVMQRRQLHFWARAARNVNAFISDYQDRVNHNMLLSFQNLPPYLKPCFLYLAVFPENYDIPVWKLIRLWIAEGFVQQDMNASLEDIAEEYLEELVANNLVLVSQRRSSGQIKTCRIHGTLREPCKREALEENLFQTGYFVHTGYFAYSSARRFCFHPDVLDRNRLASLASSARCFLLFSGHDVSNSVLRHVSFIIETFKLLRVLDISSINVRHFPDQLCQLVLLKYIAIYGRFTILPAAVCNLWNLQTLIVQTPLQIICIEADIWKLSQLRHLHAYASAKFLCFPSKTPKGKYANKHLQTVSAVSPESCTDEFFTWFPNLKKLGIRGEIAMILDDKGERESSFFDNLGKLASLENLKLLNESVIKLHSLPRENKFPAKLSKLTLMNTMLDWKYMSILGRLENLEVLKLKENAFLGEWWMTEDGGFLHLRYLHIGRTNLANWNASAQHFPRLRCLSLENCSDLKALPSGLANISGLEIIELVYPSPLLASSARKIQLLKQELEVEDRITEKGFKLCIYPPDQ